MSLSFSVNEIRSDLYELSFHVKRFCSRTYLYDSCSTLIGVVVAVSDILFPLPVQTARGLLQFNRRGEELCR